MRFIRISTALQFKIVTGLVGILLVWIAATATAVIQRAMVERERAALGAKAAAVAKSAGRVAAFRSSVDGIAVRLETRQRQLDRIVGHYFGKVDGAPPAKPIAMQTLPEADRLAAIESQQIAFADALRSAAAVRSRKAENALRRYGINPRAVAQSLPEGVGGPLIPLSGNSAALGRGSGRRSAASMVSSAR